jgi:hypothetical protein
MMHPQLTVASRQLVLGMVIGFLLLFVGFRLMYDSVIPEVFGLVLAGLVLGFVRPGLWWLSALGLCAGIVLSQRLFPVTPSAAHVAQYGPPQPARVGEMFLLWAFPTVGALLGAVSGFVVAQFRKP